MCPYWRHARWRQCAHIGATWRIRLNLCFLRSTWVHDPNSKSIGLHSSRQKSLYFRMGAPVPKIAPSHWGSETLSNTWFFRPIRAHNANGISIGSAVFAQMIAAKCVPILYNGTPLSPQNCPSHGGVDPHLIQRFLGPREFSTQTACR